MSSKNRNKNTFLAYARIAAASLVAALILSVAPAKLSISKALASVDDDALSAQLNSEFPDLNNIPSLVSNALEPNKEEVENILQILEQGTAGGNEAEQAISLSNKFIRGSISGTSVPGTLLTMAEVAAPYAGNMQMGLDFAEAYGDIVGMNAKPREDIVNLYMNDREDGKSSSTAWNDIVTQYDVNEKSFLQTYGPVQCVGNKANIIVGAIGDIDNVCARILILESSDANELHTYAENVFNAIVFAREINASSSAKQKLEGKITDILSSQNPYPQASPSQTNGFWGSIWGGITGVVQAIGNVGQSVIRTTLNIFTHKSGQQNNPTGADIIGGLPSSQNSQTTGGSASAPTTQPKQSSQTAATPKPPAPQKNSPPPAAQPMPVSGNPSQTAIQDLTAHVVDQFGNPVSGAEFKLVDGNGKSYSYASFDFGLRSDDNGYVDDKFDQIPGGSYTLYVTQDFYDKYQANVQITTDNKNLGTITMRKWGTVSAIIADSSGNPSNVNFWLVDGQGNMYGLYPDTGARFPDENTSPMATSYDNATGRLEIGPVPDGQYTLHVESTNPTSASQNAVNAYYQGTYYPPGVTPPPPSPQPKLDYPSVSQPVQVSGSDIFLGTLTLTD